MQASPPFVPLEQIDPSVPERFRDDTHEEVFSRLRREDPVHWCARSPFGPFWSVTRFNDIVEVETHPELYSADTKYGSIALISANPVVSLPMFLAMDPPKHDEHRKAVTPAVAPDNLARLEDLIRERTSDALDALPIGVEFDWVKQVSRNLTTQMLATLFDFPWEDREKLSWWSDVATTVPGGGLVDSQEQIAEILGECAATMTRLWKERLSAPPSRDVLSMLAHSPATSSMSPEEFLGNVILLIIGGNDTTRNSMSGSVLALSQNPIEYGKLCANPALLSSMIPEVIRWQTPVMHFCRTAMADTELGGKTIRKGDRLALWFVSGNRDESVIEDADRFVIDRHRPRHHLSFGLGIHRCVGNRLAEQQLRILWEELLRRWPQPMQIEVVGKPRRVLSAAIRGYETLPVRINA